MPLDVIKTLCELVSRPSVNPMGRPAAGDEFFEHRVTDYLEGLFRQFGWRWQRQTTAPKRDNIVARIDGAVPPEQGGPLLLLEVHQDTVPVDGMTIPPWTPQVRDGRVYGRGACDIKGGMACILAAAARLADERPAGRPTVIIGCTVNEEYGVVGASLLPRLWQTDRTLIPRAPDAIIVAEPTELNVVVAHKGTVRWRLVTHGRAAHSSQPERGDNAIYRMAPVVTALEQYARTVVPKLGEHPLVGHPTLSVGMISGGLSVNTVPDRCVIEIDRRLLPGESPSGAQEHAKTHLATALGGAAGTVGPTHPAGGWEHEAPYIAFGGLPDTNNRRVAAQLSETIRATGGPGGLVGVPYGTDACAFAAAGIPTVVFGPGSIEQAHTADEWVAVDQLHAATEILYRFARQFRTRPE